MDIVSWLLSRKYTDMSIVGLGAIKGANCTVKDIVHQDGINTVTFEWTGTDGTTKTRDMVVYDGTPIYVWESGNTYHYGDLAIYESQFYRCIVENNDATFDSTKWNEIGSPDGNYDIVQSVNLLPARFTAADRKLYYVIDENCFYLWNGTAWVKTISNKIADLDDVNLDDLAEGDVLVWDSVNEKWVNKAKFDEYKTTFVGTQAEWDALTPAQQNVYDIINITDDGEVINLGVYLEKKAVLPTANADNVGKTYIYTGASNANYKKGACYECQHIGQTYTWVQVSVSQDDFNALGTASAKNYTSNVRPNNTDLVESQAVYSAINNALASIYVPRGDLSCAELTADLLIPANVGNVYTMSDSGTTSALFINGAGHPIAVNDNVGIIRAGADSIMFNLMGNAFDLHDYQTKELETPITIDGTQETEVEDALGGLNEAVDKRVTYEYNGVMGAKNLFSYPYSSDRGYNGVVFTPQSDGSIIINGTTTDSSNYDQKKLFDDTNILKLQQGKYRMSLASNNIDKLQGQITLRIYATGDYASFRYDAILSTNDYGSVEFEVSQELAEALNNNTTSLIVRVSLYKYQSAPVADNVIVYPMLCYAQDIDATWQPYAMTNRTLTENLMSLQDNEDFVTPEMFGAVGDGVTDDTNAFTQALNSATTLGKKLYVPNKYYLGSKITIDVLTSTVIEGQNVYDNGYNSNNEKSIIIAPQGFEIKSRVELRNIKFKNYGIQVTYIRNNIHNCIFYYCSKGIEMNCDTDGWHGEVIIDDNFFDHCTIGIDFIKSPNDRVYTDTMIRNNTVIYGSIGINGSSSGNLICGNHIYSTDYCIKLSGENNLISDNYFDNNGTLLDLGCWSGTVSVHNNMFYKTIVNTDTNNQALPVCNFHGNANAVVSFNDNFINFEGDAEHPELVFIKITGNNSLGVQYADNVCKFNFIDLGNGHLYASEDSSDVYVTPEQFGAKGDGVTDDTDAIQSVVNVNKPIIFNSNGNYKITQRITLQSNTIYDFGGATVTCYNGAGFNVGNTENITIQNINMIGSEESGYNARIVCYPKESSADGFKLLNSNIVNYYKDSKTNNHSQWAFLGSGSNMIFDNCHIDTHLGGCWGGCVHFGYGQNIKVTNCWVYGGDDAIAPLPHCGGMFGDLSSIDVGLSVYIDNCWLASWYAYCVGIGTYLGDSETTHTEWLPPSDNVKVYVTNSKLHNHVFKDGTRNTVASHYVSCVNCEFTYDPTLREDLGYPYQSYETFYLIGANSVDDIDIDDAQFNFDDCTFDFSLVQTNSQLISNSAKPISHLSVTNSTFTNNGDCFVRLVGKVTKELLFDNVTLNLTQSQSAAFFRETIAEHIIIRNSNIVSHGGRVLMVDDNADNIQYIEITNNVIDLIGSDKCILYNSPAIGNANIIVKNNTTNGFIPSFGFMTDNNICDTDEVIPLDINSKPYLMHKSDYMLVKPQGESWLLKNLNCLAQPLAQSVVTMNGLKYYKVTKLEQAVIPFDFTAFGDNIIENTPCKTVIKSIDNADAVSIFEATSSSEYITVSEDFYLYLASGQCGENYDWSTMTVYFDDGTTISAWNAPTLIQAGKVITKVRLDLQHNTLYQSNNIIYQLSTFDMVTRAAQTIENGLAPQPIDIYNNIISYNKSNWKANDTVLTNTSTVSLSYLLLDLADPNSEIIVSPIYHEHNFEFDYYVDWNNSADNRVEFTSQELQAMW